MEAQARITTITLPPALNCLAPTPTMLARALRTRSAVRGLSFYRAYSAPATSVNQVPANDPVKRDPKPNVSETNATALSSEGSFDKVLQESVAKGEELRTKQAPNYEGTWSKSQQPRAVAMQGPRFEQTIMEDQVCGIGAFICWVTRGVEIEGGGAGIGSGCEERECLR